MTGNRHKTLKDLIAFKGLFTSWTPEELADYRRLLARACTIVAERAYSLRRALKDIEMLELNGRAKEVYRAGCKVWLRSLLEEDNERYHDVITPYSLAKHIMTHLPIDQVLDEKPDRDARNELRARIEENTAHLMDINALNEFGFDFMASVLDEIESTLSVVSTFTNAGGHPMWWQFDSSVAELHEQALNEHFARFARTQPNEQATRSL